MSKRLRCDQCGVERSRDDFSTKMQRRDLTDRRCLECTCGSYTVPTAEDEAEEYREPWRFWESRRRRPRLSTPDSPLLHEEVYEEPPPPPAPVHVEYKQAPAPFECRQAPRPRLRLEWVGPVRPEGQREAEFVSADLVSSGRPPPDKPKIKAPAPKRSKLPSAPPRAGTLTALWDTQRRRTDGGAPV